MKKILLLSLVLICGGCAAKVGQELACIQLLDRNGVTETVSFEERLKSYEKCDFLSSQPYKKVVRIFSKNSMGQSFSIITSYHPSGLICQYLEAIDGRANGIYREWYDSGKIKVEARLLGGEGDFSLSAQSSWLFDGLCTYYGTNGRPKAQFQYKNGLLDGVAKYYYHSGELKSQAPFVSNSLHGEVRRYSKGGSFLGKSCYKQDKKNGESIAYWEEDKLKSFETYEGGRLISGKYFDPQKRQVSSIDGGHGQKAAFKNKKLHRLIDFENGRPEGKVVEEEDGILKRSYFQKNGQKEGEELLYYPDKTPKLSIIWREGKIHGQVKSWYVNGQMETQREMAHNKKNGSFFGWCKDGSLMFLEEYENDLLKKGSYYKNGKTASSVIDGSGIATFFDENGLFLKRIKYKNSAIAE